MSILALNTAAVAAATATARHSWLASFALPAPASPVSHARLMDESEWRLCSAATSGTAIEETVASRVLDNPTDFRLWECEHAALMQRIAAERRGNAQRDVLLRASMTLIHRKALFEYLRDRQVRGQERRRLIGLFFKQRDYESAVVYEHGNYLRSAASYWCSSHVGQRLLLDHLFDRPLTRYERLYTNYFRAYCDALLLPANTCAMPLALQLKRQVNEWGHTLHSLATGHPRT